MVTYSGLVSRRRALVILLAAVASAAVSSAQQLPIVFVHGNGDSAALWTTTLWRFESNGYDRSLLFAPDLRNPSSRNDDTQPMENRSSTVDSAAQLAEEVTRALIVTGQSKVILVGNSRGGNAIRNYIRNGGGAAHVAKAILCGTPNHGVTAGPGSPNAEFNGQGKFLAGLNTPVEVYPGVQFMTIRSDKNDKYAQPTQGGRPSNVTLEGPELKGALNVAIPGLDHRETAYHPLAFKAMYEFITGKPPATMEIAPEEKPVLNGLVAGFVNGSYTNLPLAGVTVSVYEVDPATGQRRGAAVHHKTTGWDGTWGPFTASSSAYYEFVFNSAGGPVFHVYRTPFARSSEIVGLRVGPAGNAAGAQGDVVTLSRPRGYLGVGRDTFLVDGKAPEGVAAGVPTNDSGRALFPAGPQRPVKVVLNKDSMTVQTWPAAEGHVVIAEFH
jgi:triacylglycerol lipase